MDQNESKTAAENAKSSRKVFISAPAATISSSEEKSSLPAAVEAAAAAALAAEKREKEKSKEIKFSLKGSIMANKKKMNDVLTMWKQRNQDSNKPKSDVASVPVSNNSVNQKTAPSDAQVKHVPVSNSSGGKLMGVIRSSGRGVVKSDAAYSEPSLGNPVDASSSSVSSFRTESSALGSYAPAAVSSSGGKRRFSEMPAQAAPYRDRAAERRSLYGSSSSIGDDSSIVGEFIS